jgi:non-specific protein-tyrosine kinase
LSDFLSGESEPREVVRVVAPAAAHSQNGHANGNGASHGPTITNGLLACIPAGRPTQRAAELLGSSTFQQFLAEVADAYDVVVVDTPPLLPVADTLQVLPRVDAVLVCLRGSRTTRDQAIAARNAISRVPDRPAGVVLTGARDPHDYGSYYGYAPAYASRDAGDVPAGASSSAN